MASRLEDATITVRISTAAAKREVDKDASRDDGGGDDRGGGRRRRRPRDKKPKSGDGRGPSGFQNALQAGVAARVLSRRAVRFLFGAGLAATLVSNADAIGGFFREAGDDKFVEEGTAAFAKALQEGKAKLDSLVATTKAAIEAVLGGSDIGVGQTLVGGSADVDTALTRIQEKFLISRALNKAEAARSRIRKQALGASRAQLANDLKEILRDRFSDELESTAKGAAKLGVRALKALKRAAPP